MNLKVNDEIYLEKLKLNHSKAIFQTIDQYREELREWLPFVDFTKEEQDSIDFISLNKAVGTLNFAIIYQGCFAGLCGLKDIDYSNQKAEIGYWISPEFQNKGLATLSSKALLKYAFEELSLNRIQIRIGVTNDKSNRVAEKLQFKWEGIQRDGELLSTGFHDLNVYSMLKKEYANT